MNHRRKLKGLSGKISTQRQQWNDNLNPGGGPTYAFQTADLILTVSGSGPEWSRPPRNEFFCEGDLETHVNMSDSSPTLSGEEAFRNIYITAVTILRSLLPTFSSLFRSGERNPGTERIPFPPESLRAGLQRNKDCLSVEMLTGNPTRSEKAAV